MRALCICAQGMNRSRFLAEYLAKRGYETDFAGIGGWTLAAAHRGIVPTALRSRIRAVAKGIRKTTSKFGARLEPGMVVDVQCYEGRNLDTITQVAVLEPFPRLRSDLDAVVAAGTMVDAVRNRHNARGAPSPAGSSDPRVWCDHPGCGALGA